MTEALRDKTTIGNAAEAAEWIAQAQFDHGEGIGLPDLEAESIALARQFGLKEAPIRFRWAKARAKRAEQASVAAPVQPEPKPSTETPEPRVMLPAVIPPTPPPVTWDDAIEAMNTRHAIIDNVGGKTVIAGWEPSQLDPARMVVVFQNKESFLLRYSNRYAIIDV
jgi:hypothetical protein